MKNFQFIFSFLFLLFFTSISNAQWVQTICNGAWLVYSLTYKDSIIFAGSDAGQGVFRTTNNGQNWSQTSLNNIYARALATSGSNIFAGNGMTISGPGVYLSTNYGLNWLPTSLTYDTVFSLAVSGNNIFAGTYARGVFLSTNNGQNWTQTSLVYTILSLAINGVNIFAGTYNGVYRSTNNGQNWTQTSFNNQYVLSLAVNGSNVFAGTYNGVYRSTNNGQNWTQTSLNNQSVPSLAASGTNVFAGTSGNGVYLSTDNGSNWIQRNEGMGNASIGSLLITQDYIFAGSGSGVVYRRLLSDFVPTAPVLYSPPNGSTGQPLSLNLIWYQSISAFQYRVQLSTDSTFSTNLIVNDSTLLAGDTIRAVSGLSYLTKYYWHVNAKNANGTSNYSSTWSFFTAPINPAIVNLKVIPGGFYNTGTGQLRMRDTIVVMLVDSATCNKLDSAKVTIDPVTFSSSPSFINITTGSYYIYVFHRNHLTICSRLRQTVTRGSTVSYDFTTDSTKAYGSNMIKVSISPVIWGMIPTDANRDGYTDAIDQTIWIIQNGHSGYFSADFNGDGNVDGLDQSLWILYNGRSTYLPCYITPMR